MKRWQVFKELRAAMADPNRIGDVSVYKSELSAARARPEIEAQLADVRNYRPKVDFDALARLPENSFGRSFEAFMRAHQLQPFEVSDSPPPEMVARNAFVVRYAIIHDMVHVLTGFDTSWPGEVGVWAFVGAQGYSRGFVLAAWMAMFAALFRCPTRLGLAWRQWRAGWAMGRQAQLLIKLRIEDRFADDLHDLRAELGISPWMPKGASN